MEEVLEQSQPAHVAEMVSRKDLSSVTTSYRPNVTQLVPLFQAGTAQGYKIQEFIALLSAETA